MSGRKFSRRGGNLADEKVIQPTAKKWLENPVKFDRFQDEEIFLGLEQTGVEEE